MDQGRREGRVGAVTVLGYYGIKVLRYWVLGIGPICCGLIR